MTENQYNSAKKRNQVYACLLCDTLTKSIGVPVLFVSSRRRGNTVGSNFLSTSFQTFGQPTNLFRCDKVFSPRLKPRTSNLRMCELYYTSLPKLYNYPKYSKHWPYTVAYTTDCVGSKMLNLFVTKSMYHF